MKSALSFLAILIPLLTAEAQQINYRGNLTLTQRTALDAVGSLAYTAAANNFAIVDVSNPDTPFLRGQVALSNAPSVTGLEVWGNYAYCAGQNTGLIVINVSNPNTPSWVTNLNLAAAARDVAVYDTLVGIATATNVTLVGVSNPVTPHILTTYPRSASWIEFEGPAHRLHVGSTTGAFALQININGGNASLALYDQFDTQSLTPVAYYAPYVNAVREASVHVIDAAAYTLAGQYTSTANIRAIVSGYHFSFIGLATGIVQYLNQSAPNPQFVDAAQVPGPTPITSLALAQAGNQLLVLAGHGTGLAVFDYDALTSAHEVPSAVPRDLSLSAYPNPFNGIVNLSLVLPQSGEYQLTVFDNLGRRVHSYAFFAAAGVSSQQLDFSRFAAGQYIARLTGSAGSASLRLMYIP